MNQTIQCPVSVGSVCDAIITIIVERTLYDEAYLQLDSHFEGELGIDSVVLESILKSIGERFQLSKPLSGGLNTLREVVQAVESDLSEQPVSRKSVSYSPSTESRVLSLLLNATVKQTHYDRERLHLDMHLEGELGIDSVVLVAILRDVVQELGLDPANVPHTAATTLRQLVAELERALPAALPASKVVEKTEPFRHQHSSSISANECGGELPSKSVRSHRKNGKSPSSASPLRAESRLRDLLVQHGVGEVSLEPFSELGLEDESQSRLVADAMKSLRLSGEIKLSDCDSPAALVAYAEAHALVALARKKEPQQPSVEEPWDARSMKDFVEERSPDLFAKARNFGSYLKRRKEQHLYWYGMPLYSRCENRAVILDELTGQKREYLMFASNNYLGLANHPQVMEAICDATRRYGATNTGCRIIGGTNHLHKELEHRLARFKGREACIVYPGGYSANLGCISALVKSYDALIVDKLNHMSIVDGCKLSGGIRRIYQHNDMADLERVLQRCGDRAQGKLIVADGVFSMHGDICDLPNIVRLAEKYQARVLVDDAHATGVLGERGTGTAEHFGMKGQVDLELGTMSKTLAGMGGFVVGNEEVIEYLRFYSNSYVFAANIPAGVAAGLIASIDLIEQEPERVKRLWSNIRRLKGRLESAGFDLENTQSAILPIVIGDERQTMEMGRAVRARGLFCQTVVFPGVPSGQARLRVSVTSEHTIEDLERAAEIFISAGRETQVLREPSSRVSHQESVL